MAVHRFLNPSNIPAPRGYTHVVETKGPSRTIYMSGQFGMTTRFDDHSNFQARTRRRAV